MRIHAIVSLTVERKWHAYRAVYIFELYYPLYLRNLGIVGCLVDFVALTVTRSGQVAMHGMGKDSSVLNASPR